MHCFKYVAALESHDAKLDRVILFHTFPLCWSALVIYWDTSGGYNRLSAALLKSQSSVKMSKYLALRCTSKLLR